MLISDLQVGQEFESMCPAVLREAMVWERKQTSNGGRLQSQSLPVEARLGQGAGPDCAVAFTGRKASFPLATSEVSYV